MGTATPQTSDNRRDMAVTSVRIERDRLDAFKAVAAANRRSVSQELRWLIDQHIDGADLERVAA